MSQMPEDYEAPARGETVETTNQDYDYPADEDREPLAPVPDWDENNPIPVYMVEREDTPQIINCSYDRHIITDSVVEIAGAKRNRTRMVVKNEKDSTGEVYIDRNQSLSTNFAYRLDPGEEIELKHNDRVWARCAPTETANVSSLQEYVVPLDSRNV